MMSNNSANIMIEINFEVKDKIFLLSKVDDFWLKSTKIFCSSVRLLDMLQHSQWPFRLTIRKREKK